MNKTLLILLILMCSGKVFSQKNTEVDTLLKDATLQNCISYALAHQPYVQQSLINEKIANQKIKTELSAWLPQLNLNFNIQHNNQLPVTHTQGISTPVGFENVSSAQFSLTQTIFNRDVLLASRTADEVRNQAKQTTSGIKINVIVNVSKAYYSVLLAQNQIELANEDIARLDQNYKDAYNLYKGGIVDRTDYMQATISLNNSKAVLRLVQEQLKVNYANLKEQMGYPPGEVINLNYDMTELEHDISIDTSETLDYQNRIEYKLVQTQKKLLEANHKYYIWGFLPTVSVFGQYNLNYQNNNLSTFYNDNFPNSYLGLLVSFPIWLGGKRFHQIEQAELELSTIDYDRSALESSISTEYTRALGDYESNLNNYRIQKDNLNLAEEVYNIIKLQYNSGIKAYLDVITAEINLRSTQVNYLNAIFQVLVSKIDLQKALGTIKY